MSYQSDLMKLGIDTKGKYSGVIKTVCPRCSATRKKTSDPSLSVNIDEGLYKCHHCQWKGTVAIQKYNRPEAKETAPDDLLLQHFLKRGLSAETVKHFKVTQSIETMPQDNKPHKTICFNYFEGYELVNIKFKTREKMFKMVSGAKKIPYNLNGIKDSDTVIICEGEEEAMVWFECGFPYAISCPAGANAGNNNLEWLDNTYSYFQDKLIYIATDNDAPGKKLSDDLSRRFEPSNVFIIDFGKHKDANDTLIAEGKQALIDIKDKAKPLPIPEISSVEDYYKELNFIYENGYPKGDNLDYLELDQLISWKRGQFVVASGIPGSGKSTFVDQVCIRLACRKNWKFGMFSPENDNKLKSIRMAEQIAGKPVHGNNRMTKELFERALEIINSKFYFYDTNNLDDYKIDNLLRIAKNLIRQRGVDCIVFDPFNYIESDSKEEIMNEKIGKMLVKMKKFALTNDVLIVLIAHPRKMGKNTQTNEYDVPRLYDISGSHHFFNVCDNGFVVHRQYQTGLVEIHVQKIKHYFMGKVGNVTMDFDLPSGRYKEQTEIWTNEIDYNDTNNLFDQFSQIHF
jgi:twinkle protein